VAIWPVVKAVAVALLKHEELDRASLSEVVDPFGDIYGPVFVVQQQHGLMPPPVMCGPVALAHPEQQGYPKIIEPLTGAGRAPSRRRATDAARALAVLERRGATRADREGEVQEGRPLVILVPNVPDLNRRCRRLLRWVYAYSIQQKDGQVWTCATDVPELAEMVGGADQKVVDEILEWLRLVGYLGLSTPTSFSASIDGLALGRSTSLLDERFPLPSDQERVYERNELARNVLKVLHRHRLDKGTPAAPKQQTAVASGLSVEDYISAAKRLQDKGLANMPGPGAVVISSKGIALVEGHDDSALDEILPVGPPKTAPGGGGHLSIAPQATLAVAAPLPLAPEDLKLNQNARTVFSLLITGYIQAKGRRFDLQFNDPRLLNLIGAPEDARAAAVHLISKQLAKWAHSDSCTIGQRGIELRGHMADLDDILPIKPVAPKTAPPASVGPEVVAAFAEVMKIAGKFFADSALKRIALRDVAELGKALHHEMHKSTAMLSGSLAEAFLLDACDRNPKVAASYMKQAGDYPGKASLDMLVSIATGENLIGDLGQNFAKAVTNYRDLIHPDRERRTNPTVDDAMAGALVMLLRLVARDLQVASDEGRLKRFADKQLGGGT
jgi:hypothetical protein